MEALRQKAAAHLASQAAKTSNPLILASNVLKTVQGRLPGHHESVINAALEGAYIAATWALLTGRKDFHLRIEPVFDERVMNYPDAPGPITERLLLGFECIFKRDDESQPDRPYTRDEIFAALTPSLFAAASFDMNSNKPDIGHLLDIITQPQTPKKGTH